jgi:hypothetical protein
MLLNRISFRLVPCLVVLSVAIAGCPKKDSDPAPSATQTFTEGIDLLAGGFICLRDGSPKALSTDHRPTDAFQVTFTPTNIDPATLVYGDVYGAGPGTIGLFDSSNTLVLAGMLETSAGVYVITPNAGQMATPGETYHFDLRNGNTGVTSTDVTPSPKKTLPANKNLITAASGTWPITWAIDASFEADPPVGSGLELTLTTSATKAWRSIDVTFAGSYPDNDPATSLKVVFQRSETATFPDVDLEIPEDSPGTFADPAGGATGINGVSVYTMDTISGGFTITDNTCPNPDDSYFYRVSCVDTWGNWSIRTSSTPTSLATAAIDITPFLAADSDATRYIGFASSSPTFATSGAGFIDDGIVDVADMEPSSADHSAEGAIFTDTGGFTWQWVALKDDDTTAATFDLLSAVEVADVDGVDNSPFDNFNVYPGDGSAKGSPDTTPIALTPGTWTLTLIPDNDPNVVSFKLTGLSATDSGWHVVDSPGTGVSGDLFDGSSTTITPLPSVSAAGASLRYVDTGTSGSTMIWFGRGEISSSGYAWKLTKTGTIP